MSSVFERFEPSLGAPGWLLGGLVAIVAIALLELGTQRWRQAALRRFIGPHLLARLNARVDPFKRTIKALLRLAAVALIALALARPHLFYELREESRNGFDILFAVDCSKSMLADDARPNRLERAKLAIADFSEHLPDSRLGLIAFAGDAFLQCPLTLDHTAFDEAVQELDTDTIPRPGTDLATAIQSAEEALRTQPNNRKIVVIVTDGEDLENGAIEEARRAATQGVKIYTVGVGSVIGGPITVRDETGAIQQWRDASGQVVTTRLDEATLRQVAALTGGEYQPLGERGEGLDAIYRRHIAMLPRQHLEPKMEKVRDEQFVWPLAGAILLLLLEFLLRERAPVPVVLPVISRGTTRARGQRGGVGAVAALVFAGLGILGAGSVKAGEVQAQRDYRQGEYGAALNGFRDAATRDPDRFDLQYNRGDAAYRAGNYSEAEEAFRNSLGTSDLRLQSKGYYNLGNTEYRRGENLAQTDPRKTMEIWKKALQSYESALKLGDSRAARDNYEFVKQRLEELQQSQQAKNKDKKDGEGQGTPENNPGGSKPSEESKNPGGKGQSGPPQNGAKGDSPGQIGGNDPAQSDSGKGKKMDAAPGKGDEKRNLPSQSASRARDEKDPGQRSAQEAGDLLDSLKEDEGHVTARSLNQNQQNPPPASGKDW